MITVHMSAIDSLAVVLNVIHKEPKYTNTSEPFESSSDEVAYEKFISDNLLRRIGGRSKLLKINNHDVIASFDKDKHYIYVLQTDECVIRLSGILNSDQPFCKIQINQPSVWCSDPFSKIDVWVKFFKTIVKHQVSSVSSIDLCVHFSEWVPEIDDRFKFSGRAKKCNTHQTHNGRHFTGFEYGSKSKSSRSPYMKLYDKTDQLRSEHGSPRPHAFYTVPATEETHIFNLEFSFGSRCLRSLNLTSPELVKLNLSILWKYATSDFIKHKDLPFTDKAFNRAKNSEQWEVLSRQFGVTSETTYSRNILNLEDPDGIYRLNKLKRNLLKFALKNEIPLSDLPNILKYVEQRLIKPSTIGCSNWDDFVRGYLIIKPKTFKIDNLDI